jgi:hypothetical protein
LLNNGANVICIDNYFTGNRRNIDRVIDDRCFDVRHDVPFPRYEADQISNLACPASPMHYQHDPALAASRDHASARPKFRIILVTQLLFSAAYAADCYLFQIEPIFGHILLTE